MADERVSVVIPCYNHSRFIEAAVKSAADQNYKNLELVIVDDASSDDSAEIITKAAKEYKDRFSDIIIKINDTNEGAHNAINKGAALAHSNYISLLNSDDMYQPNRISSVMTALLSSGRGNEIAFTAVACVDSDGKIINSGSAESFTSVQNRLDGAEFTALSCLAENVCISTGNLVFTKALFNALGGFKSYKYIHDYDFFIRSSLVTEPIFVKDTLYLYRLHGDNTFTKIHKTGVTENRILWLDIYNKIKKGEISNPYILSFKNYRELFEEQIKKEGSKKTALWNMADKPLVRLGLSALKKIKGIK